MLLAEGGLTAESIPEAVAPNLNRDNTKASRHRAGRQVAAMPLLRGPSYNPPAKNGSEAVRLRTRVTR